MNTGDRLADAALSWLSTPYAHNAKIKGVGVDCARLVIGALEDAGLLSQNSIQLKHFSNEWHLHRNEDIMRKMVARYCDEVAVKDIVRGDILLFQYGRVCSHTGIYIGKGEVIHAYIGMGVVISALHDIIFYTRAGKYRLKHVYRFREV